jgi:hypothetical protein
MGEIGETEGENTQESQLKGAGDVACLNQDGALGNP